MSFDQIKIFLFSLLLPLISWSQIDIVFDIDNTIGYKIYDGLGFAGDPLNSYGHVVEISYHKPLINLAGSNILNTEGQMQTEFVIEKYRIYEGFIELVRNLHQRNVRISFFSAGSNARNFALLNAIQIAPKQTVKDISYKILGETYLTRISETGRFRDMFRKDLTLINKDLSNVILIDDIEFTPLDQKENLLHLKPVFSYAERNGTTQDLGTISKKMFSKERLKLINITKPLLASIDAYNRKDNIIFKDLLRMKIENKLIQIQCKSLFTK